MVSELGRAAIGMSGLDRGPCSSQPLASCPLLALALTGLWPLRPFSLLFMPLATGLACPVDLSSNAHMIPFAKG